MAIKFDFNRLRTGVKSFLKITDAAGSEVVHLPTFRQARNVIEVGDANYTILDDDSGAIINVATAATADRTYTLPAANTGLYYEVCWSVASDAQATIIEVPSGALLGSVTAQNGTGTTIVQSDGTDTKITVNDNIEPGTVLKFFCVDSTNWVVSGVVNSADADPAFS
tara:strand:- start:11621 stop:12121 length:501 start_codon:yes stop_codon:yes gene_type:complete